MAPYRELTLRITCQGTAGGQELWVVTCEQLATFSVSDATRTGAMVKASQELDRIFS